MAGERGAGGPGSAGRQYRTGYRGGRSAFAVGEGPAADIVSLNAGAALYAADVADSLKEGVALAQDAQASKLPLEKLKELANFTRVFLQ